MGNFEQLQAELLSGRTVFEMFVLVFLGLNLYRERYIFGPLVSGEELVLFGAFFVPWAALVAHRLWVAWSLPPSEDVDSYSYSIGFVWVGQLLFGVLKNTWLDFDRVEYVQVESEEFSYFVNVLVAGGLLLYLYRPWFEQSTLSLGLFAVLLGVSAWGALSQGFVLWERWKTYSE